MYSENHVSPSNLRFPFALEAGNGFSVQRGGQIPVEFWLEDDRFRERNFAVLVRNARDPEEMLVDLAGVYPGSLRGVKQRLGMTVPPLPPPESTKRWVVIGRSIYPLGWDGWIHGAGQDGTDIHPETLAMAYRALGS